VISALLVLAEVHLRDLSGGLRSGRVRPPYTPLSIQAVLPTRVAAAAASALEAMETSGFGPVQIALTLDLLAQDRAAHGGADDAIDLVTTGPEAPGVTNRDTSVVVRELFAHAGESVLVAGYAVYQGRHVFRALADRMRDLTSLRVRLFLDVRRGPGDTSSESDVLHRFTRDFYQRQWVVAERKPQLFYDPRSLAFASGSRTALHAKCIVVDQRAVFVSSANFTEAAQERNIEVGLLIRSGSLARKLTEHFDAMVAEKLLVPAL
jgi:phosphatidylserine/phosphatidylglycerophosphate/cardiolipin synthase-like enzyme